MNVKMLCSIFYVWFLTFWEIHNRLCHTLSHINRSHWFKLLNIVTKCWNNIVILVQSWNTRYVMTLFGFFIHLVSQRLLTFVTYYYGSFFISSFFFCLCICSYMGIIIKKLSPMALGNLKIKLILPYLLHYDKLSISNTEHCSGAFDSIKRLNLKVNFVYLTFESYKHVVPLCNKAFIICFKFDKLLESLNC